MCSGDAPGRSGDAVCRPGLLPTAPGVLRVCSGDAPGRFGCFLVYYGECLVSPSGVPTSTLPTFPRNPMHNEIIHTQILERNPGPENGYIYLLIIAATLGFLFPA